MTTLPPPAALPFRERKFRHGRRGANPDPLPRGKARRRPPAWHRAGDGRRYRRRHLPCAAARDHGAHRQPPAARRDCGAYAAGLGREGWHHQPRASRRDKGCDSGGAAGGNRGGGTSADDRGAGGGGAFIDGVYRRITGINKIPFALSLSKGRSFFWRCEKKNGASTSSARTEVGFACYFSSARTIAAPSTIAFSFAWLCPQLWYFIPQSGAIHSRSAST